MSRAVLFVEERFGRSTALEVDVTLPGHVELVSAEAMLGLDRFARFLEADTNLGAVTSVLELMGRLNRLLNDDDPQLERTSESSKRNAELIELLALDDPLMHPCVVPEARELGPRVTLEVSSHGGHVGFVSGLMPGRSRFWTEQRIGAFFTDV